MSGICRFRATLYECPPTSAKRREMEMAVSGRIDDLHNVRHCLIYSLVGCVTEGDPRVQSVLCLFLGAM